MFLGEGNEHRSGKKRQKVGPEFENIQTCLSPGFQKYVPTLGLPCEIRLQMWSVQAVHSQVKSQ